MEKITINNPKKVNRLGIHFGKKVIVTNITTSEECIILRLIDGIYKVYNGKTISTGLDLKVHVTGKPPDELIVTAFYMEIPEDIEQMIMPIGKWANLNIDENYAVEQTDIITITCNKEHNLQHQLHGVQTIIEHNTIKEFIEITFSVKLNIEKRENKLDNIDGFNVFIYLLNGTNWVHYLVHHDGMQGITEWQTLTFRIIPKSMYNKIKIEAGLRNTKAGSVSLKDVKISQIDNPPKYNFTNFVAATCIGKYFKVDNDKIGKALEDYTPTNNRSQVTEIKSNTFIVDCYNANPTSMDLSITNFNNSSFSNKLLILGDMFELGEFSKKEQEEKDSVATNLTKRERQEDIF